MRKQLAERAVESKKKDFVRGKHIDPVRKETAFHVELFNDALLREGHGCHRSILDVGEGRGWERRQVEREGEELTNLTNRLLLWNEDCDLCRCSLVH